MDGGHDGVAEVLASGATTTVVTTTTTTITKQKSTEIVVASNDASQKPTCRRRRSSVRGLLFARSIRAYYAILHLLLVPNDNEDAPIDVSTLLENVNSQQVVVVRIQTENEPNGDTTTTAIEIRSWLRTQCKVRDLLLLLPLIQEGVVVVDSSSSTTNNNTMIDNNQDNNHRGANMIMKVSSIQQLQNSIHVQQTQVLPINKVESIQQIYIPLRFQKKTRSKQQQEDSKKITTTINNSNNNDCHHGSGGNLEKRKQSDSLSQFLLNIMIYKLLCEKEENNDYYGPWIMPPPEMWIKSLSCSSSSSSTIETINDLEECARQELNKGGVLDIAGGSGHVSMGLSLRGIQSTVIDPRPTVGKLPRRDRKYYQKELTKRKQRLLLLSTTTTTDSATTRRRDHPPSLPHFQSQRAWFGKVMETEHRNPNNDNDEISVVRQETISRASAFIALHPDEATEAVVDAAIKYRIPFVVVPCCVFARLFPNRYNDRRPVTTRADFINYLQDKAPNDIRRTILSSFDGGANVALWATF